MCVSFRKFLGPSLQIVLLPHYFSSLRFLEISYTLSWYPTCPWSLFIFSVLQYDYCFLLTYLPIHHLCGSLFSGNLACQIQDIFFIALNSSFCLSSPGRKLLRALICCFLFYLSVPSTRLENVLRGNVSHWHSPLWASLSFRGVVPQVLAVLLYSHTFTQLLLLLLLFGILSIFYRCSV